MNVGNLLTKGVDARRRALGMKADELDRRIKGLKDDLKGTAGTIEQRRMKIREEIGGIEVDARASRSWSRTPSGSSRTSSVGQAGRSPPPSSSRTRSAVGGGGVEEIASKLEVLAEDDRPHQGRRARRHQARQRAAGCGKDVKKLDIQIDTFRYDAGIAAVLVLGLGMMFVNVMVGRLIAAPIMALVLRDRMDAEYKKRAIEQAPEVIRQAAKQVGRRSTRWSRSSPRSSTPGW